MPKAIATQSPARVPFQERAFGCSYTCGATSNRDGCFNNQHTTSSGSLLIDYYCADVINIFYTEAKYSPLSGDGYELKFAAQFTDPRSIGDDRLTGDSFSTNQWGVKTDLGLGDLTLTLAYTDTATGTDMRSPWGGYPGYTSVQVQDFRVIVNYDFPNP